MAGKRPVFGQSYSGTNVEPLQSAAGISAMKHPAFEAIRALGKLADNVASSIEVQAAADNCNAHLLNAILPAIEEINDALVQVFQQAPSVRFDERDIDDPCEDDTAWRFRANLMSLREFAGRHDELPRGTDVGRILTEIGVIPDGDVPDTEYSCLYASFKNEGGRYRVHSPTEPIPGRHHSGDSAPRG